MVARVDVLLLEKRGSSTASRARVDVEGSGGTDDFPNFSHEEAVGWFQ